MLNVEITTLHQIFRTGLLLATTTLSNFQQFLDIDSEQQFLNLQFAVNLNLTFNLQSILTIYLFRIICFGDLLKWPTALNLRLPVPWV
jgi:hypothetical protein